jgi:hypothetical protein
VGGLSSSFEYGIRTCAVVNGSLDLKSNPPDLGFERGDARPQFLNRKGIEILASQCGERIVGAFREEIVRFHRQKVDPKRRAVNKRRTESA